MEKEELISVTEAEKIIRSVQLILPEEEVSLEDSVGRILLEEIVADRDFPPFDRVMMDGIAIKHKAIDDGVNAFKVTGLQAAGTIQQSLVKKTDCVEVMTGAVLPIGADTVIPYELIELKQGTARLLETVTFKGQHVHLKGSDRKRGDLLIPQDTLISPAELGVLATVGKINVKVKKLPTIAIVSTGDELVEVHDIPAPHQIRKSNSYTLLAALNERGFQADTFHLNDSKQEIKPSIEKLMGQYDILLLSGGVSRGKKDFIPEVLNELNVETLFHRVAQKPGKPFWFGYNNNTVVFGFPGNPVSTFACFYRYFLPWLLKTCGKSNKVPMAILDEEITFKPALTFFLQVKISSDREGRLMATPIPGNGSGDLLNLINSDGFLELPSDKDSFPKGSAYPCILYRG